MAQQSNKAGRMPVSTWKRLGVNEADVALHVPDHISGRPAPECSASDKILWRQSFEGLALLEDATGLFATKEMKQFMDRHSNSRHHIRIPKNHHEEAPILIFFALGQGADTLTDDIIIEAEEGSCSSIILKYTSPDGTVVHHNGRTRIWVHQNAKLQLVRAQLLGDQAVHNDVVGALVEEGGQLQVIQVEMGAARPLSGCNLLLTGHESFAGLDILYVGDGDRSLDLSCRIEHRGKKTTSSIRAKGILAGRSKKIFRDTLDFISGASGSKGREEESVLMLSPRVRNISVPILLCGEDDVEGEHAATSGRPDEGILFYLMSRGISEPEAMKLLAEAAFSSVIETIPHQPVRDEILEALRQSIAKGENQI